VAALVAIAVFFGAFVLVIQVIRHRTELDDSELALLKTRVNLFSSPAVFSQWLEVEGGNLDPAWGAHTFGGPAKLLEGESRVRSLGWQGTSVELAGYVFTPNVYTAFRQLIEDFTLPGALVVMLLWGGLSGRAYWEVLRGKRRWLPVLILFYSVTLASYLSNWMNYNTLLLAWLMLWALFHLPSIRLLARKPAEKAQPVLRTKSRYRLSSPGHAN
jgi:oligosaccharide repeat unit polymerase